MTPCSRVEELFSACWEDELSVAEREALEGHIAACAACRSAYDEFVRAMEAVQALPRLEARPGFSEDVLARVHALEAPGAQRARRRAGGGLVWWGAWERGFQPALAAAALTVVVGVGAYLAWSSGWLAGGSRPAAVATRAAAPASAARALRAPAPKAPGSLAEAPAVRPAGEPAPAPSRVTAGHPAPARPQASTALAARARTGQAVVPDSLFDHTYDLEFAFDPVNLRRAPGEQSLRPVRPMPASDVGRKASITF